MKRGVDEIHCKIEDISFESKVCKMINYDNDKFDDERHFVLRHLSTWLKGTFFLLQ